MSVQRGCEICGGRVRPVGDKSGFGFCENCGLVYFLTVGGGRRAETRGPGGTSRGMAQEGAGIAETAAFGGASERPGFHWTCPDCGAELTSEVESDLGFLRTVHIREYHPNRPA